MRNIKLTLAYDGTDFCGWQVQPGQPTVQGTLIDVLETLTQIRPTVYGAGRTDAGVHAAGQVANFKAESTMTAEEFQRALNSLLPPSIRVLVADEVGSEFHARWSASAKNYQYRIYCGSVVPPFIHRYVHNESYALDFAAMAEAARRFEGEHDFSTFAASTGSEEDDRERSMTRIIYSSELVRVGEQPPLCHTGQKDSEVTPGDSNSDLGEEWAYVVRGRSFLRYMVRKMVGTLIEVGRGRLAPNDIPRLLAMRDRTKSGPTIPAKGLCMEKVEYANQD